MGRRARYADSAPALKSLADKGAAIGAGEHDDLVIAAALACWWETRRPMRGAPRCKTAEPRSMPLGWCGMAICRVPAKRWTRTTPLPPPPPSANAARQHTLAAVETLVSVMEDLKAPHSARVAAANGLLDRGHGKATQHIEAEINVYDSLSLEDKKALLEALEVLDGANEEGDSGGPAPTHH